MFRKSVYPQCQTCSCRRFKFVPSRPEEVGMWWLPRRPGFNAELWKVPCKCKHDHTTHNPVSLKCNKCSCREFISDYLCVVCDSHQEEHDTIFENESERRNENLSIGKDYLPLAEAPGLQELVFGKKLFEEVIMPR